MTEPERPVIDDGRRFLVACKQCDSAEHLSVEADPIDDTLMVACRECGRDIAAAKLLGVDVSLRTHVDSLDQLDPQIRPDVIDSA